MAISQDKINLWYSLVPTLLYDFWIKKDEPLNVRKDLMNFMNFEKGDSLIELGCGTGRNLEYLPKNIEYTGLDMNKNMLNSAKRKLKREKVNAIFYLGNARETKFQDSFFDKGILTYALSGIPGNELVLDEMSRIIKRDGIIGILDFTNINSNFFGGVAGISSLEKLVNKNYLKLIKKKNYIKEYDSFHFRIHNLYIFENKK